MSLSPESQAPSQTEGVNDAQIQALIEEQERKQALEELIAFRETDEGKQLVSWVRSQYDQMSSEREKERREWVMNLAFYNRIQDGRFTGKGAALGEGRLIRPPSGNKVKRVVNRIRSVARTEISKLSTQPPMVSVVPSSSDHADMFAASAGENVYLSVASRAKIARENSKAAFWVTLTGNGFLKTYWDSNKMDHDSGVPGDITVESVSPFHIFVPDLREEEIENQPYVLNMYAKPVEWVQHFYAEEMAGVEVRPSVVSTETLLESRYLASNDNEGKADSCMVYEMWIKPGGSKYMPNGGVVTIVDRTIVGYSPYGLPYKHGMYPFAHIKHVPTGKFYGASVIEDLRDLQSDYNDNVSLIANTRKIMGKPQLLAQKGSITSSKMTNEIGLVVEYRPGTPPPSPMPLSELPSYVFQEQERLLTDIEDISGQHQVSKGSAPPGVTAATAISFLQERDDSYIAPTFQSMEEAHEKVGRSIISLAVQFWNTPRLVKVAGDESGFDVRMLQGSELANGTDLRVERGSTVPESMAARRALILDLMNTGHVSSQEGLELLELGGARKLMDTLQADKRQAQRENIRMRESDLMELMRMEEEWDAKVEEIKATDPEFDPEMVDPETGLPLRPLLIPVNEFDNHEVHIEVHNLFRKSQMYEDLPEQVKNLFDQHVKAHEAGKRAKVLQDLLGSIPTDGSVSGMMGGEEGPPEEEGGAPAQETISEQPPSISEEI